MGTWYRCESCKAAERGDDARGSFVCSICGGSMRVLTNQELGRVTRLSRMIGNVSNPQMQAILIQLSIEAV